MQDQIIKFLKQSDNYLSGEEISRHLKISRAAIWKNIEELRKDGYDIVAQPHLGYKLVSAPDKLVAREIQFQLGTKTIGKKIFSYDTVDSTMEIALRLGLDGEPEGTIVCAEAQTKGKGRLGRNWVSPKGKGLYFSILLRPAMHPSDVSRITLMSAVALCEAVRKVAKVDASIKWPNDILIKNKKLAGILTELNAEMDRVRFVTVGIGINVNTSLSLLPTTATSLKEEAGQGISRVELLKEILRTFENCYMNLKKDGFELILERWKKLSSTLGKRVKVVDQNGETEGIAVDLDPSGALVIRNDFGLTSLRMTGDVIQIR